MHDFDSEDDETTPRRIMLPPLRTFMVTAMSPDGGQGDAEGVEGHRVFVEECGALIVTRIITTKFAQQGATEQFARVYAPGTWYGVVDVSKDFESAHAKGFMQ